MDEENKTEIELRWKRTHGGIKTEGRWGETRKD